MRNVFLVAVIGAVMILGLVFMLSRVTPLTVVEAALVVTTITGFMSFVYSAGAKVSVDEAAKRVEQVERKTEISIQKSVDNHALLEETKKVIEEVKVVADKTHVDVNSGLTRQLDSATEVGKRIGKDEGRKEAEAREDALSKEKFSREQGQPE